jgi:hypothetical protein
LGAGLWGPVCCAPAWPAAARRAAAQQSLGRRHRRGGARWTPPLPPPPASTQPQQAAIGRSEASSSLLRRWSRDASRPTEGRSESSRRRRAIRRRAALLAGRLGVRVSPACGAAPVCETLAPCARETARRRAGDHSDARAARERGEWPGSVRARRRAQASLADGPRALGLPAPRRARAPSTESAPLRVGSSPSRLTSESRLFSESAPLRVGSLRVGGHPSHGSPASRLTRKRAVGSVAGGARPPPRRGRVPGPVRVAACASEAGLAVCERDVWSTLG